MYTITFSSLCYNEWNLSNSKINHVTLELHVV